VLLRKRERAQRAGQRFWHANAYVTGDKP
jgi:hypothetical protein